MTISITIQHLTKTYRTLRKTGNTWRDLLARTYEYHTAINDLSVTIREGELIGLVGPNGAGKTTLMKMLSGILLPTSGSITALGYTPFEKNISFLKQIAFVMGQRNQLIWDLPARDSFELNRVMYDISPSDYRVRLEELTQLLDCKGIIDQPLKTVSLGQRMRLELVGSLLHAPRMLFLDEPTLGLDVVAQGTIREFMRTYQRRLQPTIIFTSHYMRDVAELADRLLLIDKGTIRYDGTVGKLRKHFSHDMKEVRLELGKKLTDKDKLSLSGYRYQYTHPLMIIRVKAHDIPALLTRITQKVDYRDITVTDPSIEDIMMSAFQQV
ncbi:ABC transporter [Candidatus Roizmanbacteria bacterium CG10_big_fil_rev_8_21_14_0_10_45_7]|uniref:ABC transporter n=1 Tax=Candidatus Roizmanbacteria bacterium CG10_big_fil_rev_8_21_14_0_10_45_7 TaxID=1974854 RepID=A0A2M8KUX2_9BACT|nr:MAG: ABC transporter [Candidatus Roizmanbacteria bacterium CG10_big_fil_rev_8_21_14_0_10_45_7]